VKENIKQVKPVLVAAGRALWAMCMRMKRCNPFKGQALKRVASFLHERNI